MMIIKHLKLNKKGTADYCIWPPQHAVQTYNTKAKDLVNICLFFLSHWFDIEFRSDINDHFFANKITGTVDFAQMYYFIRF